MIERQARRSHSEPRRESLVLAAYRILADRGFEGLRTREVAAAVKINIATLHYYFPTKEALVAAVLAHAMARFRTTLTGGDDAAAMLRSHFAGLRRLEREEPELFAVMGELALRAARDKTIAGIMSEVDQTWHATLRTLLRRARDEGSVNADLDPSDVAALIVATLKGVYLLPAEASRQERLSQALRQLERWIGLERRS